MEKVKCYFDGSCVEDHILGAWGYHIQSPYFIENCGILSGGVTSNVAEYNGLLHLLKELESLKIKGSIIHGDNKMVVNIVNKKWGIKKGKWKPHNKYPDLKKLAIQCGDLIENGNHTVKWISRDYNTTADGIAKSAYDKSDVDVKNIPDRYDNERKCYDNKHKDEVESVKEYMMDSHSVELTDYDVMKIKEKLSL